MWSGIPSSETGLQDNRKYTTRLYEVESWLGGDELFNVLLLLFNPPVYAVFCVADVAGIRSISYIMSDTYYSAY